jgi:gluconolactonase
MKVDREGNIFGAGPGGIHVISPDGKHLGSIETGVRLERAGDADRVLRNCR